MKRESSASEVPVAPERPRPSALAVALGGAVGLAIWIALATWPPGSHLPLFEAGHWLGPASDMLRGKVPFRDTFPIHGFLSDGGLDYLLFRIVEPTFASSVWLHQAIGTLFQPAIYLVAAAATRRPLLCLALTPLMLALAPGLVFDRAVVPLIGLAVFLLAISERPSKGAALAAGILAPLGVLYALEFGSFVLVAELAFLGVLAFAGIRRWRMPPIFAARRYLLGMAAVVLPAMGLLAWGGALRAFWKTSFIDLPFRIHEVWGLGFPGPLRLFRAWRGTEPPYVIPGVGPVGVELALRLYAIPIAAIFSAVAGAVAIRRRRPDAAARFLVAALACLLCFRYLIARFHFEAGNALVGPTLLAGVLLLMPLRPKAARLLPILGLAAAVAWGLGGLRLVSDLIGGSFSVRARLATCPGCVAFTDFRGGGIRVPAAEVEDLRAIRALVQSNAGPGPMLDLSNRPALTFFLDRVNPTRFYQVPMMEFFQDEVIADLERNPPSCVLLAPGASFDAPDGRSSESRIPSVWQWVSRRFPRRIVAGENVLALPARP